MPSLVLGAPTVLDETERRLQRDVLAWSQEHLRDYPWRRDGAGLYEVLVAEVFLNVTAMEAVADVYPRFLERFPDPQALARAERETIVETIRPLGLYNRRAAALETIAEALTRPDPPRTFDQLVELPRVGPYVANAVRCLAFGEARPMLDRNAARVYSRVFGLDIDPDRPSEEDRQRAARLVPAEDAKRYNLGLIDFAAEICRPNPRCEVCFASGYCDYYRELSR